MHCPFNLAELWGIGVYKIKKFSLLQVDKVSKDKNKNILVLSA